MAFPREKTKQSNQVATRKLKGYQPKKVEENPLFLCEFFEGMEVLQIQGVQTGEFIFGMYFAGKLCGHCYFGEVFTPLQSAEVAAEYLPSTWNELEDYVSKNKNVIWYFTYARSQYAWIYERVIEKI